MTKPKTKARVAAASELKIIGKATTPRAAKAKFAKGVPKPVTSGRARGTRNKTTVMLKEAILEAAARVGSDGRGKMGLVGYLENLARTNKPVYARLLEKVLPMQIALKESSNQRYTPEEAIARLRERGLPVPESLMALSSTSKAVVADALNDQHEDGDPDDLDNRHTYPRDGLDDLDGPD